MDEIEIWSYGTEQCIFIEYNSNQLSKLEHRDHVSWSPLLRIRSPGPADRENTAFLFQSVGKLLRTYLRKLGLVSHRTLLFMINGLNHDGSNLVMSSTEEINDHCFVRRNATCFSTYIYISVNIIFCFVDH